MSSNEKACVGVPVSLHEKPLIRFARPKLQQTKIVIYLNDNRQKQHEEKNDVEKHLISDTLINSFLNCSSVVMMY